MLKGSNLKEGYNSGTTNKDLIYFFREANLKVVV
jgi:hypothetical protein